MRHVNFDLKLDFDNPTDQWFSEQILVWNLFILALRNVHFLRANPGFPKLYDTDMVYLLPEQLERSPSDREIADFKKYLLTKMHMQPNEAQHHLDLARGVEIFRDIPRMVENGGGDCDNWAAARAAELTVAGVPAKPCMTHRVQEGRTIYHAKVLWPDGTDEDPSLIKGMGGRDRAAERRFECWKNWQRYDTYFQQAKVILATEDFRSEDERTARAAELKAKIDSLGLLPKDGVFRVGPPKPQQQALVGRTNYYGYGVPNRSLISDSYWGK